MDFTFFSVGRNNTSKYTTANITCAAHYERNDTTTTLLASFNSNATGLRLIEARRSTSYITGKHPGDLILIFHTNRFDIFNKSIAIHISERIFSSNKTECALNLAERDQQIPINATIQVSGRNQYLLFNGIIHTSGILSFNLICKSNMVVNPANETSIKFGMSNFSGVASSITYDVVSDDAFSEVSVCIQQNFFAVPSTLDNNFRMVKMDASGFNEGCGLCVVSGKNGSSGKLFSITKRTSRASIFVLDHQRVPSYSGSLAKIEADTVTSSGSLLHIQATVK